MVVELEIAPKRKPETYAREVQCDIIDTKKLGKIAEEDEDESDEFDKRFDRFSGQLNRQSSASLSARRGSVATGIVETKRETSNNFNQSKSGFDKTFTDMDLKEMPKDEAKKIMQQSDFQQFLAQSSRYIERALGSEFNFKGEFFVDD